MTSPLYVRSTDGSNSDTGATWALAKLDLAGFDAGDSAGDICYVSQSHAESTAGAVTISPAGTLAAPTRIVCANDGAEPPTAVATTATVTTTGGNALGINGNVYVYGIAFSSGSGFVNAPLTLGNVAVTAGAQQVFESCKIRVPATGSGSYISLGGGIANAEYNRFTWQSVDVKTGSTGAANAISISCVGIFRWIGGTIESSSALPATSFFGLGNAAGRKQEVYINGVDFSNLASTVNIATIATGGSCHLVLQDCKGPGSWSGVLVTGTITQGCRFAMYNSFGYPVWVEEYLGSIKSDTGVTRSGGSTESNKMVSVANAEFPGMVLRGPEISIYNSTTGSAIDVTLELLTASAITDADFWIEVEYLGTGSTTLSSFKSTRAADFLATPANLTSSAASWSGLGGSPVAQKCVANFTPQVAGYIKITPCLAKASQTVYYDYLVTAA